MPYLVTSDGTLSVATAALIAGHVGTLNAAGRAPARVAVLELGPGSGLFARSLLQRYAALRNDDANLPPLSYVGIDGSHKMVEELSRRGVVSAPGVEVDFLVLDLAYEIEQLEAQVRPRLPADGVVIAVCNYVLDSLPAAYLRRAGDAIVQMETEVRLDRDRGKGLSGLSSDTLAQRLEDANASVLVRSRERPADADDPLIALAARHLAHDGAQAPLNVGALRCLAALDRLTAPDGLTLVNDYAIEGSEDSAQSYQSFAGSITTGLHFPTIDAFVQEHLEARSVAPRAPSQMIISRLLVPRDHPDTEKLFQDLFSLSAARRAHALVALARTAQSSGHWRQAAASYERAIAEQPYNWSILTEAAGYLSNRTGQHDTAEALAEMALTENPICGAAWNIVGDCRYRRRDFSGARSAYQEALDIDADDARAHLNLVYCDCAENDLETALTRVARALLADANGPLTAAILERQKEIIQRLSYSG